MKKIEEITPILLEWNVYNGFTLDILGINSRALLGISFSSSYCYIDLLFFQFKIFDLTD